MTLAIYTIIVSPHQLPLARELASRVGAANFRYVYTKARDAEREGMGWGRGEANEAFRVEGESPDALAFIETCDVLLVGGIRPIDLLERRLSQGRITMYMSERWFKPIPVLNGPARWLFRALWAFGVYRRFEFLLPGSVRMLVPSYRRMARRFAALFAHSRYRYLPIGPRADADMRRMAACCGIPVEDASVLPWGYFVAPSSASTQRTHRKAGEPLRVVCVGRLIALKHFETVIKAVAHAGAGVSLSIVGDGPEKPFLRQLAQRLGASVEFVVSQPIAAIRGLMRSHDVLVFASNSFDGWGAVVSEALEEGVAVVGTSDSGASATMLPQSRQFRCGDWRTLARILRELQSRDAEAISIARDWSAAGAAERLLAAAGEMMRRQKREE